MPKLPVLTGIELVKILEKHDFHILRSKGSHVRMKSSDDRYVTIPVHSSKTLPKGLLRKIIREDLEITLEEFLTWL